MGRAHVEINACQRDTRSWPFRKSLLVSWKLLSQVRVPKCQYVSLGNIEEGLSMESTHRPNPDRNNETRAKKKLGAIECEIFRRPRDGEQQLEDEGVVRFSS